MIEARLVKMPSKIKDYTTFDEYGQPIILLSDRLTYEQRLATYEHELAHINGGDLLDGVDVGAAERERHGRGK